MNIITEYSAWFIPVCLLIGLAYGFILYFRSKNDELPQKLKRYLFVLRTIVVALIVFLLLGPMIKNNTYKNIKPVLVLAIDGSRSMEKSLDGHPSQLFEQARNMEEKLQSHFDIQNYTFGSEVLNQPCDSFFMLSTNIGELFETIDIQYKNANLGAVVVISDGINNSGKDPIYSASPLEASIYTVGIGDTTATADLSIADVIYNKTVYKGNYFPIQVTLQAQIAAGSKTSLSLKRGDQILEEKQINITQNRFFSNQIFYIKADSAGFYHYQIEFSSIDNENNTFNNYRELIIEVLDRKQKAMIIADAPHPDVGMLKEILEESSFEVESGLSTQINPTFIKDCDIVILHSLPSLRNDAGAIIKACSDINIPILFIIGNNTNLSRFNSLQTGLAVTQQSSLKEIALPMMSRSFSSFMLDNNFVEDYQQWFPLVSPFGDYKMANSMSILFYQKIGSVETNYPLIAFNNSLSGRYGFICGEGIWRWRLDAARRNGNSRIVNEVLSKSVQLLLSDSKNKRFKVYCEKEYTPYDHIIFRAELYNQAQELITNEEVALTIRDEQNNDYNYAFGVEQNNYKLDAGNFSPGIYQWRAQAKIGMESFVEQGTFTVASFDLESEQTMANHNLLMNISTLHNGHYFSFSEINQLTGVLQQRSDLKPIRTTITDYFSLINVPWLLFTILAMLFLEWFLRKFFGSY